jgi:hypothetical protein
VPAAISKPPPLALVFDGLAVLARIIVLSLTLIIAELIVVVVPSIVKSPRTLTLPFTSKVAVGTVVYIPTYLPAALTYNAEVWLVEFSMLSEKF